MTALPAGATESVLREKARQELARRDFLRFVLYTKPDYVADPVHLFLAARLQAFVEACERLEAPRLMLIMAPQHGKSELSSRRLPAWILGRNPRWRVALMSYGADWARDLSQDARDIVTSERYQELWSHQLNKSSTAVDNWKLTPEDGGGGMVAVGRDGAITGRPAEALLVDDPVKNRLDADSALERENTWKNWPGFRNRVQMGGGILMLYTAWHHDDLPSRIRALARDNPEADQWEVVNLPAIAEEDDPLGRVPGEVLAPHRFSLAELVRLKASMPASEWQALYCGRPTSEESAIFKRGDIRFEDDAGDQGYVVQFADTAYSKERSADYSVVGTWRFEPTCYRLLDVHRERIEFPALKKKAVELFRRHHAQALVVEDIGSGKSLIQELRAESNIPVLGWKPDRDKIARAHAVTWLFEAQKVVLPRQAPWLDVYVREMEQFPASAHDDQVDMTTMALTWAQQRGWTLRPAEPVVSTYTLDKGREVTEEVQDLLGDVTGEQRLRTEIQRVRAARA